MRRYIVLIVLAVLPVLACTQDQIGYDNSTVEWNHDRIDSDGVPLPHDVVVTFNVYAKRINTDISFLLGTSTELFYNIDLTGHDRAVYIIGVSAVTIGQESVIAWSDVPGSVQDQTFGVVPGDPNAFILTEPYNLRRR